MANLTPFVQDYFQKSISSRKVTKMRKMRPVSVGSWGMIDPRIDLWIMEIPIIHLRADRLMINVCWG